MQEVAEEAAKQKALVDTKRAEIEAAFIASREEHEDWPNERLRASIE